LEAALDAFPGTVLLVSHDRALLDAVARRLLAIEDGTVRSYDGGWAEYHQRRAAPEVEAPPPVARDKPKPKAPPKQPQADRSELELLEREISQREAVVAELEGRLSEDWSDVETLAAYRQARDDLQGLLSRWERLFEEAQA
jgi:ATP-binding cassette subfamily F protein 3